MHLLLRIAQLEEHQLFMEEHSLLLFVRSERKVNERELVFPPSRKH